MLISTTLRYTGESLNADNVTSSLGVEPTSSANAGDVVKTTSGGERVLKSGFWEWAIKVDCDDINKVNEQIAEFADVFKDVFGKLSCQNNCTHSWIDIHVIDDLEVFSVSLPLNIQSLKVLNQSGLLVDITFRN